MKPLARVYSIEKMSSSSSTFRDAVIVQREIHDTRAQLRTVLGWVKEEAMKIGMRAEFAVEDLRKERLTFHRAIKIDSLVSWADKITPLEEKLIELSKELGELR